MEKRNEEKENSPSEKSLTRQISQWEAFSPRPKTEFDRQRLTQRFLAGA